MSNFLRHEQWGFEARKLYASPAQLGSEISRVDLVSSYRPTSWIEPDNTSTHVVLEGETFFSISYRYYKDIRFWSRLADFNPHVLYPLDLQAKTVLKIPPLSYLGFRNSVI